MSSGREFQRTDAATGNEETSADQRWNNGMTEHGANYFESTFLCIMYIVVMVIRLRYPAENSQLWTSRGRNDTPVYIVVLLYNLF